MVQAPTRPVETCSPRSTCVSEGALARLSLGLLLSVANLFGQAQLHRLAGSDAAPFDAFGVAVDANDDWLVVGALDDRMAGADAGAVHVFDPATGVELHKLVAPEAAPRDQFGASVSLRHDVLFVGAPGRDAKGIRSGAVYRFNLRTGTFAGGFSPEDGSALDAFGNALAAGDSLLLVGAYEDDEGGEGTGSVYAFEVSSGNPVFKLTASDGAEFDAFGYSVALDDAQALIGAPFASGAAGRAYLFDLVTGEERAILEPAAGGGIDLFGSSVATAAGYAVVGAPNDDEGGQDAGAVYVFDSATGVQLLKLTAAEAEPFAGFGTAVALHQHWLVVGAPGATAEGTPVGAVYAFDLVTGVQLFRAQAQTAAGGDRLGQTVAAARTHLLAGAPDAGNKAGAALLFSRFPLLLRPTPGGLVEIRFAGNLQASPDLSHWSDLEPPPPSPMTLAPDAPPIFFRVR